MILTSTETVITILAVAAGTVVTRFLPFAVFPENKKIPKYVEYLGRVLPSAVIALLVVYCLKSVSITTYPFGVPELIAITAVVLLHLWKHNSLLSIGGGTVIYMLLVQFVFI